MLSEKIAAARGGVYRDTGTYLTGAYPTSLVRLFVLLLFPVRLRLRLSRTRYQTESGSGKGSGSVPGMPSSHHDSRDGACQISGKHNATNREPWSTIGSVIVFQAIAGAASLRENEPTRRAATRRHRMQSVGVIRQLTRYPVKSMQGEALPFAALTLQGFAEDRRYAFVQATSRSPFPWLTVRELPELLY